MSFERRDKNRVGFEPRAKREAERMLPEMLQKELERYAIGARLRALRLGKKLGLVELGRHTGLSPALLSKLETGRLHPTLPTLQRIAIVFGVGLDHVFAREAAPAPAPALVHRRKERMHFPDRPDGRGASFEFRSLDYKALDRPMSAYHAEFRALTAERAVEHAHPGVELIYVLDGTLELRLAGEIVTAGRGDSIYFDASRPHSYRAPPLSSRFSQRCEGANSGPQGRIRGLRSTSGIL